MPATPQAPCACCWPRAVAVVLLGAGLALAALA